MFEVATKDVSDQESTKSTKTIHDVPPEVLEVILKKLDSGTNSILPYRLVHPDWKAFIDDHLQQSSLNEELVGCSKAFIVQGTWLGCPPPKIYVPEAIFYHPGNPFPSRSLSLQPKSYDLRVGNRNSITRLDKFTAKFGTHLTTFVLDGVDLKFPALIKILRPLSNLKILKLCQVDVEMKFKYDLESFPALPHLTTLGLKFLHVTCMEREAVPYDDQFYLKFIDAYAEQLVSLRLELRFTFLPLQQDNPSVENCPFRKLEHLKVYNPSKSFLDLSCIPPLKRLSIVIDNSVRNHYNMDVIMKFVDKFSDTLESLDLDFSWSDFLGDDCKQKAIETGILKTATVTFPYLRKLTFPYPTDDVEAAIIKRTFLVKFPALRHLHLFHFRLAHEVAAEQQVYNDVINEFLRRENYSGVSTTLIRISVWLTGEQTDRQC